MKSTIILRCVFFLMSSIWCAVAYSQGSTSSGSPPAPSPKGVAHISQTNTYTVGADDAVQRIEKSAANVITVSQAAIKAATDSLATMESIYRLTLMVLGISAGVAGFFGYRELRNIRKEAKKSLAELMSNVSTKAQGNLYTISLMSIEMGDVDRTVDRLVEIVRQPDYDKRNAQGVAEEAFSSLGEIQKYAAELKAARQEGWTYAKRAVVYYFLGSLDLALEEQRKSLREEYLKDGANLETARFDRELNLSCIAGRWFAKDATRVDMREECLGMLQKLVREAGSNRKFASQLIREAAPGGDLEKIFLEVPALLDELKGKMPHGNASV